MSLGLIGLINDLANPYGTLDTSRWNLQRGSFLNAQGQGVVFFIESSSGQDITQKRTVDQISDSGGRRLAIYEYPYVDGQILDDLGRKGEKFSFTIKFFGSNYQVSLKNFLDVVINSSGQGTLSHPVRGAIKCRFQEYELIHRYDEWNSVSIRATFLEDNTGVIQANNLQAASANSALRSGLSALINLFATASNTLFAVTALLTLPNAIFSALNLRLKSINDAYSSFLGQLAATFSTDSKMQSLMATASSTNGGLTSVNSGTNSNGVLPPVYQVGFSQTEQASINSQLNSFVNANQISTQQAIDTANQIRTNISTAITEAETQLGNSSFDLVIIYRQLAISVQQVTQSCIAATQPTIKVYTLQSPMSLRAVAYANGLTVDRQNDIEALNPYLASINYILSGSVLLVPSA